MKKKTRTDSSAKKPSTTETSAFVTPLPTNQIEDRTEEGEKRKKKKKKLSSGLFGFLSPNRKSSTGRNEETRPEEFYPIPSISSRRADNTSEIKVSSTAVTSTETTTANESNTLEVNTAPSTDVSKQNGKVVVVVEMNHHPSSSKSTSQSQAFTSLRSESSAAYTIGDIELSQIEPPRQFQNIPSSLSSTHQAHSNNEPIFTYDFINESTCRHCRLGVGSTGVGEYCLDCDDYPCDPFDDEDDVPGVSDCDSLPEDDEDEGEEGDDSPPLTIIYKEAPNSNSLVAVPLPAYRLPAQRKAADELQYQATAILEAQAASPSSRAGTRFVDYQSNNINCIRELVPVSVYDQRSTASGTFTSNGHISATATVPATKVELNGYPSVGGEGGRKGATTLAGNSSKNGSTTTTLVQIHSQPPVSPHQLATLIRPPSSLPLHPQSDINRLAVTSVYNQNSLNYRYYPITRTQQPPELPLQRPPPLRMTDYATGQLMNHQAPQHQRYLSSSTHSSPLLHHHHVMQYQPNQQNSPLFLFPEPDLEYRRHSMNNGLKLPLYATLNSTRGRVESNCPTSMAGVGQRPNPQSLVTPNFVSRRQTPSPFSGATAATVPMSVLSNQNGYYQYPNYLPGSHQHQQQNQQPQQQHPQSPLVSCDMNYNPQNSKEQQKNEELMRELKGYEASSQYIIPDKYGHPPPGMGNSFDYGPNANCVDTFGEEIGNDVNQKRNCSQWRMTLFVFYWIIWIVFLIGVVIIVAANARTA